jgi:hypothetical protein
MPSKGLGSCPAAGLGGGCAGRQRSQEAAPQLLPGCAEQPGELPASSEEACRVPAELCCCCAAASDALRRAAAALSRDSALSACAAPAVMVQILNLHHKSMVM